MANIVENYYKQQLINKFENRKTFTRKDLHDFYLKLQPGLTEGTFDWRISELKKRNVLKNVGRGIYTLCGKPKYKQMVGNSSVKIARLLEKNFSDMKYCIWETSWLNLFAVHQAIALFTVLEIEKELIQSVFYFLKDNNIKDLFLQPNSKEMEIYVIEKESSVVLKTLISRSPLQRIKDKKLEIIVPTLEKMLVDIFCDRDIFYFYQGEETIRIYENAIDLYAIDFSRLYAYARRRGREKEIKDFLIENFQSSVEGILK